MANQKISELSAATALDGAELVELVQGGVNVQATTQDIADLVEVPDAGNVISSTAIGSEPGSPATGDTDLYSNSPEIARYDGSVWQPWGPLFKFTKPVDGDYAWVDQGSASVDTANGGIYLSSPGGGSGGHARVKTAPSTPYTVTVAFRFAQVGSTTLGLIFRESGSGKVQTFHLINNSNVLSIQSNKLNSLSSFDSSYGIFVVHGIGSTCFLRIGDNGTLRKCYWSIDGQHWIELFSVSRTDFITANQVGFYVDDAAGTTLHLLSWKEGT